MTDPNHIAEARKKAGRPQIREVFLRNGAVIPADRDDLPDWVYESVFELLDSVIQQAGPAIQHVAPAVQGEPLRYTNDGALAECPCCGSIDVGGAHDTVSCYNCDLTVTKPRPLQSAIDAWNTRAGRTHPAPDVQGEPVAWRYRMLSEDWEKIATIHPSTFHPDHKDLIIEPLYTAPRPAEQQPFEWPLLDAPALIGGVVVGKGCSTGTVVAIAKRKHQYEVETSPEEHARREKAFKDMLRQIHEGIGQQPAEQQPTKTLTECPECQGNGGVETPGHSRDGRIHVCRKCRGDGEIHNPAPDGATQPAEQPFDYTDAYRGARDDLAIWKRRALGAERRVREQDQIIDRMGDDLNAISGPTFMGEPVLPKQPAEQQPTTDVAGLVEALEFYAKGEHFTPYEPDQWDTVSGEPLNFLHHDDGADGSAGFVENGSIAKAALAAHRKGGDV